MPDYLSYDLQNMDRREAYGFLTSSVVPRPIAYVTSLKDKNIINGAPFSYFNVISTTPPLLVISVGMRGETRKDTAVNIEKQRAFVVNMVEASWIEKANLSSKNLKPHDSEVALTGLTPIDSETIHVPGIKEASVRFECTLNAVYPVHHDAKKTGEIIIGHIKRMHVRHDLIKDGVLNPHLYAPIARLGGTHYAHLGEIFSLKRPE